MKILFQRLLVLALILLFNLACYSQIEKKFYLDKYFNKSTRHSFSTVYYLLISFNEDGIPIGEAIAYYKSGELYWRGTYLVYDKKDKENNVLDGNFERFYKNGNKLEEGSYSNNKLDGEYSKWYENGVKAAEMTYVNNKVDGVANWWYDNGQKSKYIKIDKASKEGIVVEWYMNGVKSKSGRYLNGKLNANYTTWYANGKIKEEGIFNDGRPVGGFIIAYDELGKKQKVFKEDFKDASNTNKWPLISDDKNFESEIIAGEGLLMKSRNSTAFKQIISIPLDLENNFVIKTSIDIADKYNKSSFGIIWGYRDRENFCLFSVNSQGEYTIAAYREGIKFINVPTGVTTAYHKSISVDNTMEILRLRNKLYFSINGETVHTTEFFGIEGDKIGFFLDSKSDASMLKYFNVEAATFKYLHVKQDFPKEAISIKKEPSIEVDDEKDAIAISKVESKNVVDVDKNIPTSSLQQTSTYAIIIGNEDYQSRQRGLSSEQNVDFAENDAIIFADYCEKTLGIPRRQIKLLMNATSAEINRGLAWLSNLSNIENGESKLIFYYSGHGLPDEKTKEAYIIPIDVSGNNLKYAIKVDDIYSTLTKYPTKQVVVLLDACFSGGARNKQLVAMKGVKIEPKEGTLTGNLVVLASSQGSETSAVYQDKQHGYFTYYLLKKLQESEGQVDLNSLFNYISKSVRKESGLDGKIQTPQINYSTDIEYEWEYWRLN